MREVSAPSASSGKMAELMPALAAHGMPGHDQRAPGSPQDMPEMPEFVLPSLRAAPPEPSDGDEEDAPGDAFQTHWSRPPREPVEAAPPIGEPQLVPSSSPPPGLLEAGEAVAVEAAPPSSVPPVRWEAQTGAVSQMEAPEGPCQLCTGREGEGEGLDHSSFGAGTRGPPLPALPPLQLKSVSGAAPVVAVQAPTSDGLRTPRKSGAAAQWRRKCLLRYASCVGRFPLWLLLTYTVLLIVLIAAFWRPFELEEDFNAFIRADGEAMRRMEAFLAALREQKDLADGNSRRLEEEVVDLEANDAGVESESAAGRRLAARLFIRKSLTFFYEAREGNALDERVLRDVRDFELSLRNLPDWRAICHDGVSSESKRVKCDPGESLTAIAWPSRNRTGQAAEVFEATFDAKGLELLPPAALLAYMEEAHTHGDPSRDPQRYFPKDYSLPSAGGYEEANPPGLLRTKYEFHIFVGLSGQTKAETSQRMATAKERYKVLIENQVYPLIIDTQQKYEHIRIYYSGDTISGYEITRTLQIDTYWACGSIAFVTLYMWFHTRSFTVSICSLLMIFASVPAAYVLTPASKTTIASFLSVFLITGIGSDVVFVFTDFWDQGKHIEERDERVAFLIAHAGKACLATSLTTAVSFLANLASVLQPLREFGLFMGLCVMGAFLLVLLFLPPLLVYIERMQGKVDRRVIDISSDHQAADALALVPVTRGQTRRCPCGGQRGTGRGNCTRACLLKLVSWIAFCPTTLLIITVFLLFVFAVFIATNLEVERGVPKIFPADHNQVAGQEAALRFSATSMDGTTPPSTGKVCVPEGPNVSTLSVECMYHLCDATTAGMEADGSAGATTCWRSPAGVQSSSGAWQEASLSDCHEILVRARFAAALPPGSWLGSWVEALQAELQEAAGQDLRKSGGSGEARLQHLEALALEDWETGLVRTSPFFNSQALHFHSRSINPSASCQLRSLCFSGRQRCSLPGWQQYVVPHLEQPRALTEDAAPEPVLPGHRRTQVAVVFGLRAPRRTPVVGAPEEIWSFDPSFEPSNPWAQRAMHAMCAGTGPELKVLEVDCWMGSFRRWLLHRGRRFPSRDFDEELIQWYLDNPVTGQQDLWMINRKMRACKMAFEVNVAGDGSADGLLDYAGHWDEYINSQNAASSITANRAWYTASPFVRAEAEKAIMRSTFATIAISAGCGLLGMLLFTWDFALAFIVLALVLEVITGLAFFMVAIMQWAVGAIEVLSLVVFVGYSVTYSLHVAHHYSEAVGSEGDSEPGGALPAALAPARLRLARTKQAMARVGGATLSSAVSTVGSSAFLLGCTLRIFGKLGLVVMAVTVLSIIFALVSLPAALILLGPVPSSCFNRLVRQALSKVRDLTDGPGDAEHDTVDKPLMPD